MGRSMTIYDIEECHRKRLAEALSWLVSATDFIELLGNEVAGRH